MTGLNVVPIRPAKVRNVGKVHVWRHESCFEVIHESASGESYGPIECFSLLARDEAIACAVACVHEHGNCHLGDIAGEVF